MAEISYDEAENLVETLRVELTEEFERRIQELEKRIDDLERDIND